MTVRGSFDEGQPPAWWDWKLEFTAHLLKRMVDRGFSETDLCAMLEQPIGLEADVVEDRWRVRTSHEDQPWEVIVEPDPSTKTLVVITAYPC